MKVLSVDVVNSKLLLTHKKSLVNSKMASITSYSDLRTGMIVEGCVVSIKPSGLVVTFYNNVKVSDSVAARRAFNHVQNSIWVVVSPVFECANSVCMDRCFVDTSVYCCGDQGFVPRREFTDQHVEYPEKLFYLGQTVKCRVVSFSSDEEKLILSLRVSWCLVYSIL